MKDDDLLAGCEFDVTARSLLVMVGALLDEPCSFNLVKDYFVDEACMDVIGPCRFRFLD